MKKIIALVLIITLMFLIVGCRCDSDTTNAENNGGIGSDVFTFVDEKTGVNYLIYSSVKKGGITPRLNPDGSIMVTKPKEK